MTCGLILAAGQSRRMGSPKALLGYRGETFLDRLIGLFARRCAPVVVVLGAEQHTVRAGFCRADQALLVENPDFLRGQLSSMQCGLRAVPRDAEGVLFTLVDHPAISSSTIDALLDPAPAAPLRIPTCEGRRGHPIWISRALVQRFLALPPSSSAKIVVREYTGETECIAVDDPGILADIDDPAAYASLLARSGG